MWWKSPAKKSTKSHRITEGAILDYSRVRVKPGMWRDYPRAVLVQVAPTLYLEDDRGLQMGCPFHKLQLHEIGELLVSENANGAETSNPRGVLETQ